jgi:hypothetical protein
VYFLKITGGLVKVTPQSANSYIVDKLWQRRITIGHPSSLEPSFLVVTQVPLVSFLFGNGIQPDRVKIVK